MLVLSKLLEPTVHGVYALEENKVPVKQFSYTSFCLFNSKVDLCSKLVTGYEPVTEPEVTARGLLTTAWRGNTRGSFPGLNSAKCQERRRANFFFSDSRENGVPGDAEGDDKVMHFNNISNPFLSECP